MENLNCEIIYTDDLFFKVNKHIVNKKRKGILFYFLLVTMLTVCLLLLDVFGPDNIHTLYAGFYFMAYSVLSLVALYQTPYSVIKRKIIKKRKSLPIKSIYSFNEDSIIVESESEYSKQKFSIITMQLLIWKKLKIQLY
jgi:hypothetical protein